MSNTTSKEVEELTNWEHLEQLAELRWSDRLKAKKHWQMFLGGNPTDDELSSVVRGIRFDAPFQNEAAAALLERSALKNKHLGSVDI